MKLGNGCVFRLRLYYAIYNLYTALKYQVWKRNLIAVTRMRFVRFRPICLIIA